MHLSQAEAATLDDHVIGPVWLSAATDTDTTTHHFCLNASYRNNSTVAIASSSYIFQHAHDQPLLLPSPFAIDCQSMFVCNCVYVCVWLCHAMQHYDRLWYGATFSILWLLVSRKFTYLSFIEFITIFTWKWVLWAFRYYSISMCLVICLFIAPACWVCKMCCLLATLSI